MTRRPVILSFVLTLLATVFHCERLEAQNAALAWNPCPPGDAAGYILWYSTLPGSHTNAEHTGFETTAASVTLTNLHANTKYYFSVVAYDTAGVFSKPSTEISYVVPLIPLEVTWPEPSSIVYGTPLGASQLNAAANIPGTFVYKPALGTVLPGGSNQTLTIVFTPKDTAKYRAVAKRVTINVLKAPLIISVNSTNKAFGAAVPALTVSFSGFVNSNTIASLPRRPVLTTTATSRSPAGVYPINVSGAVDANYAITYENGSLTVLPPAAPAIVMQPQSVTAIATTSASFSSVVTGSAPLSIQWYKGGAAIANAHASTLTLTRVTEASAGSYYFKALNSFGAVTSSVVTLTVLPANTIATAAGVYNGLFFPTNADGTSAATETNAGFLGNCVVAASGAFSAKLYIQGHALPLTGAFSVGGDAAPRIPVTKGLPALAAALHLDLINGTQQITGAISSPTVGRAWTSPLVANLTTNAFPDFVGVNLLILPESTNAPANSSIATDPIINGVVIFSATLGDGTAVSQTAPISKDGNVPIYASLYNNTGLLEGWLNLTGDSGVTGSLIWIRPAGVVTPPGFPEGFDALLQVTGGVSRQ